MHDRRTPSDGLDGRPADAAPQSWRELYEAIRRADASGPFDHYEAHDVFLGSMSLTIKARDPQHDRMVAIKLWRESSPADQAALLDGATIYSTGQWCGRTFTVTAWRDVQDGAVWMEQPRDWQDVRDVYSDAGTTLGTAHALGIEIPDFNPANIVICEGTGEVMIACLGGSTGAPGFIAPERLRGQPGDVRSDQYSFCASLWWAWFGELPYPGETHDDLLAAIERGEIQESPDADVPPSLVAVLRRGLAANPDERHRDMLELLDPLFADSSDDSIVGIPSSGPMSPTPIGLLDGKSWDTWGPEIGRRHLTDQVVGMLARATGRPVDEIAKTLNEDPRRYLLLEQLSGTSHAMVFAGIDVLLGRDVVIKIHCDLRVHATQQAIRESQVMARFVHPNIVQIHDLGEQGPWMYSVIERCGHDFQKWHRGQKWRPTLQMLIGTARGLAHLHEMGYVHGDIKTTNILVQDGVAKLADFGHAARVWPAGDDADEDPSVLVCGGTPGFVAPEVRREGRPGFAGDVFALAVTIWICLFGEKPFPGVRTISEGVRHVENHEIRKPARIPAGLPKSVLPLLERALNPNPRKRPHLDDLIQGLQGALDHAEKLRQRRRWRAVITVGALVTLGVGFSLARGTAWYQGTGHGAPMDAVLGAFDPLTRAEIAAAMGDGETAVAELNRTHSLAPEMSAAELERAIARTVRIAEVLEPTSPDHAMTARLIIRHFRRIQQDR